MGSSVAVQTVLSAASLAVTLYFWLVKARRETPRLECHQLHDFRVSCRTQPGVTETKRLCFQQPHLGGVLVANHSSRQNSIILFIPYLVTEQGELRGDWGYSGEDQPPWNIAPESSIAFSPACFFDVPSDYEIPENLQVRIELITTSGKPFSYQLNKDAPRILHQGPTMSKAA